MKIEKILSNYCCDCKKSTPFPDHFEAYECTSENPDVEEVMVLCDTCLIKLVLQIKLLNLMSSEIQKKAMDEIQEMKKRLEK